MSKPEFIGLPRSGLRCPHTGLSRSALNNLVLPCKANGRRPPVLSISDRKPGKARGRRLIVYDSLMSYLNSRMDTGSPLRNLWAREHASQRHGQQVAALCEVLIANCDDLPDDAVLVEK